MDSISIHYSLFEDIATQLTHEMNKRVIKTLDAEKDTVKRIVLGIRMYIRRAHKEPDRGRFLCRFSFITGPDGTMDR